jgi:hypothetical protein
MEQSTQLQSFSDDTSYQHALKVATKLASSELLPATFKNKPENVLIALDLANRSGVSPLMIMQNLNIIQGRPSFSSSYIIASINTSTDYGRLRYKVTGKGDTLSCIAYAKHLESGEIEEGPEVTMQMAVAEGWTSKSGSKWKTMPQLMIRYRAAAFFGRLYTPEILMGMHTTDEIEDMPASRYEVLKEEVNKEFERAMLLLDQITTLEDLKQMAASIDTSAWSAEEVQAYFDKGAEIQAKLKPAEQ